jgi:hypothetical protein
MVSTLGRKKKHKGSDILGHSQSKNNAFDLFLLLNGKFIFISQSKDL